jgi:prepilin-type N-terminal cleavage/methylation domain-containing protein
MRRAGFSLVELTVGLALLGVIGAAVVGLVQSVQRLARAQGARVELAEAVRIAGTVLVGEARVLEPGVDLGVLTADSVALRAFRGAGVVCGVVGEDVLVRYRGLRDPEPDKDSVLVLGPEEAAEQAVVLGASAAAPGGCPTGEGEEVYRWRLGIEPPAGTPVLLYESGSYHLAAGAFRYRRGESGRQPLTTEVVEAESSGFRALAEGGEGEAPPLALEVRLAVRAEGGRAGAGWPFRREARLRIAFLNRP